MLTFTDCWPAETAESGLLADWPTADMLSTRSSNLFLAEPAVDGVGSGLLAARPSAARHYLALRTQLVVALVAGNAERPRLGTARAPRWCGGARRGVRGGRRRGRGWLMHGVGDAIHELVGPGAAFFGVHVG